MRERRKKDERIESERERRREREREREREGGRKEVQAANTFSLCFNVPCRVPDFPFSQRSWKRSLCRGLNGPLPSRFMPSLRASGCWHC